VDQVRGADKRCVLSCSYLRGTNCTWYNSALENALRRHASGSGSGAFSGKGQTLGGSSSNTSGNPGPQTQGRPFENLDPKVKILLGLIGAYFLFWCLS